MQRVLRVSLVGLSALAVIGAFTAVVVAISLGVGFCLHVLVPSVDLGSATITGMLAIVVAAYMAIQFLAVAVRLQMTTKVDDEEDDDDEYEVGLSDEQLDVLADRVADAIVTNVGGPQGKRAWSHRGRSRK